MGDIIEITTQPHKQVAYYRVSARALKFLVKVEHGAAVIGLAKEPLNECRYYIVTNHIGHILIRGPQGHVTSITREAQNVSNQEYRKFWIAWDSSVIRVGRDSEPASLSYPNNITGLNCVVFSTYGFNTVSWKVELPPESVLKIARTIPCKEVTGGELKWVKAEDQLPDDAIVGGFDGECLYIIRAPHSGSLTPGKFVPSEGVAYIPWGGAANEAPDFEILCGYNFIWAPTKKDKIPVNAYSAGYSETGHETLYIGRANHNNCMVPGKVQPSHRVCYIAYEDKELPFQNYEILTVPEQYPHVEGDQYLHIDDMDADIFIEPGYGIPNIQHVDFNDSSEDGF